MLESNHRPKTSIAGASVEAKNAMFVAECSRCLRSIKKVFLPGIVVSLIKKAALMHKPMILLRLSLLFITLMQMW